MAISLEGGSGKRHERPDPCRECGSAAWWNGTRRVSVVRKQGEAVEHVTDIVRRRARCSWKPCALRSWTLYEADSYPHRLFGLVVVASAVGAVVFAKATLEAAALVHRCSRRSVGRWKRWIGELADARQLHRACTRLATHGLPGGLALPELAPAGRVLHLLDRLVELFGERGVRLPDLRCPLASVLRHQLEHFGEVVYLTKSSPPLHADLRGVRF